MVDVRMAKQRTPLTPQTSKCVSAKLEKDGEEHTMPPPLIGHVAVC